MRKYSLTKNQKRYNPVKIYNTGLILHHYKQPNQIISSSSVFTDIENQIKVTASPAIASVSNVLLPFTNYYNSTGYNAASTGHLSGDSYYIVEYGAPCKFDSLSIFSLGGNADVGVNPAGYTPAGVEIFAFDENNNEVSIGSFTSFPNINGIDSREIALNQSFNTVKYKIKISNRAYSGGGWYYTTRIWKLFFNGQKLIDKQLKKRYVIKRKGA